MKEHYVAEMTIKYKRARTNKEVKISSSQDAHKVFQSLWDKDTLDYSESMCVMYLDRNNVMLGFSFVSHGGTAGTVVDPKTIFAKGLLCGSHSFMLCHNHPSGNLKPSHADLAITKKIKNLGDSLELECLDHLILTSESYYSMADSCDM